MIYCMDTAQHTAQGRVTVPPLFGSEPRNDACRASPSADDPFTLSQSPGRHNKEKPTDETRASVPQGTALRCNVGLLVNIIALYGAIVKKIPLFCPFGAADFFGCLPVARGEEPPGKEDLENAPKESGPREEEQRAQETLPHAGARRREEALCRGEWNYSFSIT